MREVKGRKPEVQRPVETCLSIICKQLHDIVRDTFVIESVIESMSEVKGDF